jgi:hypothetical protein
MQTKTNMLVFSLAAILALSVVAIGEIPQAVADKKEKEDFKKNFSKKPQFESADCRVAMPTMIPMVESALGITVNPDGTLAGADCSVEASFNKKADALEYIIQVTGMEVVDTNGIPEDDIGKMHFHNATMFMMGNPDDPMGPQHILNIFKKPAMDDEHLVIQPIQGIFSGIWDDNDVEDREGHHDDTLDISAEVIQEALCQGETFLMVHGNTAGLPGFIKASIQPTDNGEKFCEKKLHLSTDSDLLP